MLRSLIARRFVNFGVGLVLRSEHSAVKAGDHVYGVIPFQEYTVVAEPAQLGPTVFRVLENKEGLPWSVYVGVCGMPGEYSAFASSNHGRALWVAVRKMTDQRRGDARRSVPSAEFALKAIFMTCAAMRRAITGDISPTRTLTRYLLPLSPSDSTAAIFYAPTPHRQPFHFRRHVLTTYLSM